MTESQLAQTLRLQLEAQCARAFNTLHRKFRPKCAVTLICFDYSLDDQPFQHVAYKTSIRLRSEMVGMLAWYVARWADPLAPPIFHSNKLHGWLPELDELTRYSILVKRELKTPQAETGFCLLCGKGTHSEYVGTAERDDVAKMFKDDLIPWLSGSEEGSSLAI